MRDASSKPGALPCACTAVKKLSRVLGRSYDAALSRSGINITQLAVMQCIARHDGEPLARVAHELQMASLYRAIHPMVRDGWLALAAGTDARSRSARVTKKGSQVLAKANKGWEEVQDRLIRSFGVSAYETLMNELNRLADCSEGA
jgi:DNA-binding MarR family transcriptional regulator